jgi:hypothetical protein
LPRLTLVSAIAASLVFTGQALASYTPKLVISQAAGKTTIHLTIPKADDATLKLTIYTPASVTATLNQAPGTQIGDVTAQVNAKAISPDAILPLTGTVSTDDPAKYTSVPAAVACAGAAPHQAVWLLTLTAAGQTLPVPVYVDATTGAEAAFGSTKLVVCLPSPDIPPDQGGATFGAKLLDVNFTTSGIFGTPTAAIAAWPTVLTPYVAGTGTPNPAGTVTAIGIQATAVVTFKAKQAKAGGRVSFTGKVSAGGIPAPGQSITILSGSKKVASAKTSASGTFAASAKLKKGTYSLRAKLTAADQDVTAQGCALVPTGAPTCVSATAAGGTSVSTTVRFKVK